MLEVMLAVVVLSAGLLFALRALSAAARAETHYGDYSKALLLLREKVQDVGGVGPGGMGPDAGGGETVLPAGGDFGRRAPGFSWSLEPIKEPDLPGGWGLVRVSWKRLGRERSVEARTLLTPGAPPVAPGEASAGE
ncbi:MAG: hypothetical protein ABIH66_05510 [bacterium]